MGLASLPGSPVPGQPKAQDLFRLVGGKRSGHPEHPSGATLKLSHLQGTLGQPCSQRASGAHFPRLETRTHVSSFSQADEPPHILEFRQRPLPWLPEAPDGPLLCLQEQLRERQSRGRPAAWVPAVRVPRRLVYHSVVSLPSPLPDHPGPVGTRVVRHLAGWVRVGGTEQGVTPPKGPEAATAAAVLAWLRPPPRPVDGGARDGAGGRLARGHTRPVWGGLGLDALVSRPTILAGREEEGEHEEGGRKGGAVRVCASHGSVAYVSVRACARAYGCACVCTCM